MQHLLIKDATDSNARQILKDTIAEGQAKDLIYRGINQLTDKAGNTTLVVIFEDNAQHPLINRLSEQMNKLEDFLIKSFPYEFGKSMTEGEGPVDMVIRLLTQEPNGLKFVTWLIAVEKATNKEQSAFNFDMPTLENMHKDWLSGLTPEEMAASAPVMGEMPQVPAETVIKAGTKNSPVPVELDDWIALIGEGLELQRGLLTPDEFKKVNEADRDTFQSLYDKDLTANAAIMEIIGRDFNTTTIPMPRAATLDWGTWRSDLQNLLEQSSITANINSFSPEVLGKFYHDGQTPQEAFDELKKPSL